MVSTFPIVDFSEDIINFRGSKATEEGSGEASFVEFIHLYCVLSNLHSYFAGFSFVYLEFFNKKEAVV